MVPRWQLKSWSGPLLVTWHQKPSWVQWTELAPQHSTICSATLLVPFNLPFFNSSTFLRGFVFVFGIVLQQLFIYDSTNIMPIIHHNCKFCSTQRSFGVNWSTRPSVCRVLICHQHFLHICWRQPFSTFQNKLNWSLRSWVGLHFRVGKDVS